MKLVYIRQKAGNFLKFISENPFFSFFCLTVILYYIGFLCKDNILIHTDLGRHLSNGKLFIEQGLLNNNNYYSYTCPEYPCFDHHWGSGVLFYIIQSITGFTGLSAAYIILCLATIFIYIRSEKETNKWLILTAIVLLSPFIGLRYEIRPEVFTYLFGAIVFRLLGNYIKTGSRKVYFIPVVMLFWVNMHIYFVLGFIFISAAFMNLLNEAFGGHGYKKIQGLLYVTALSIAAVLVNPGFAEGAVYPLTIINKLGMQVLELLPVWEALKFFPGDTLFIYFIICSFIIPASCAIYLPKGRRSKFPLYYFLCWLAVTILSWLYIRNIVIFGFVSLPLVLRILNEAGGRIFARKFAAAASFTTIFAAIVIAGCIMKFDLFNPVKYGFGIGISRDTKEVSDYIDKYGIKGPVFNNFESGGFLIYCLFPKERVFTDNRPESYPKEFFDEYFAMFSNEDVWRRNSEKYGFNTIFLELYNAPYIQGFAMRRLRDPEWGLAFKNNAAGVFVRFKRE